MRTATALAALNALALGLILLLYMGQRDLADRVASSRRAERAPSSPDGALLRRLESLEASLAALRTELRDSPAAAAASAEWQREDGAPTPVFPAPEVEQETAREGGAGDEPAMESFRRRVRRAIELNQEEDRIARAGEMLEGLVRENKIAPLSSEQKEKVASVLTDARGAVRLVWAGVPDGASREQRAQVLRTEYETLRGDIRRKLEELVSPADAQTILDEQLRLPRLFRERANAAR